MTYIKYFLVIVLMGCAMNMVAQTSKVMSYNIRLDTEHDGVNQWPKRTDKVYALLKKYNPDILGVQEALHHQLQDILNNFPEYISVGVGRDDGETGGEYSAVLFKKDKYKLHDQNTFWLSETPSIPGSKSWDAAITRVASWAVLEDRKSKRKFFVLNTHFDHIGKEARANSAQLIKDQLPLLAKNLPVIVIGDFNAEPSEKPYAIMTMQGGVKQLSDTRPADNKKGTFCTFEVNSIPCKPIDYIFHSSHWTVSDFKVIDDHDGTYYPSDHLPVLAELKLR